MQGSLPEAVVEGGGEVAPALSEEELDAERRAAEEAEAVRAAMLDALGVSLASSRSKAIAHREASGIELEWEEDEEHYEGIDDANRGERRSWRGKPPGQADQQSGGAQTATTSTVFINITRPYVDAASARVSDMLLPTDDRSWGLKATPIPELASMQAGKFPPGVLRQAAAAHPGQPDAAKAALEQAVAQATAAMDEANERAGRAQKRIEDWHVQCQWHAEVRKVIEDACKIGTGILKGPVPQVRRQVALVDGALVVREEIQPGSYRIDPWNFYPDPACGENVHNGSHCWERDDISEKELLDLIGAPGYLGDQIRKVIEEGAVKATRIAPDRPLPDGYTPDKSGMFEIWYFTGLLRREDLEATGCQCPEGQMSVPAQVTMVNNRVVKAVTNPLDTGDLPYDVMVWQKRTGHWAGVGVSRQIRTPQEIVVGAGRNLMDNAGRAGGPQLVVQQGVVAPHDGIWEVTPWKVWLAGQDADTEHIEKAFRFVTLPILQAELTAIIQLGLKLAEDVTGLPLLMQGQQGQAPDTVGGMQILNNNSSTVLRRIARIFDDQVTEPHVRRYYTYLLMYGEDEEKGDFQVDARGSSALVQRDIETQSIGEMAKMVMNPTFGIDPKKWAEEWLKGRHLDPKRFRFDDDQWKQIVENMQKAPQDPRLAVAQLRAQVDERLKQMDQQFEASENERDRQLDYILAEMERDSEGSQSLADLKAKLADTTMKLRTQVRLSREQTAARQVVKPSSEPAGRAPAGRAFVQ